MEPARPGIALCDSSRTCTERARCYRSPMVRAITVGAEQAWLLALVQEQGPCEEFRANEKGRSHDRSGLGRDVEGEG